MYELQQDYEKQSEELERLRALLTQHNIPFDSQQGKRANFCCANDSTNNMFITCDMLNTVFCV